MQSEDINNNNNKLKQLRKDKGLSIEAVSSSLKLTTDVISKLEESNFDNMGAYTYVRGYLGQYAKLLEVDAQQFIDLIPKSKLEVPLVNTSSSINNTIKLKKHSKNLFNYVVGTFIVAAVSFSGYYLLKNYSSTSVNNIEIAESTNLDIVPQTQNDVLTSKENKQASPIDDSFHYSSLIPAGVQKDKQLEGDEIQLPLEKNVELSDIQSNNLINTGGLNAELSTFESTKTDAEQIKEVARVKYNIIIDTTETSWVKVENQDGKLHNDLLQPGSISLSSDKPVHFRIGNEKNVKLTINGKSIDLSNFSSKDVADFNWPQEG